MRPYHHKKDELVKRLNKVEGQIKGIKKMIEDDKYCVDILIQIAAVRSALNKVGSIILKEHVKGCVKDSVNKDNSEEILDELVSTMLKFMS